MVSVPWKSYESFNAIKWRDICPFYIPKIAFTLGHFCLVCSDQSEQDIWHIQWRHTLLLLLFTFLVWVSLASRLWISPKRCHCTSCFFLSSWKWRPNLLELVRIVKAADHVLLKCQHDFYFFLFSQNLNQASVIVGQYDDIYHEIYFSASLYAPWSVSLYLYFLGFQAFSRQDGFIAIFDYLMRVFFV